MPKSLVVVLSLAVTAAWGAPSGAYVCYKPDGGKSAYPWDTTKWWFDSTDSVPTLDRVPTADDLVFLYSSKNDRLQNKLPMSVPNGVAAETGDLTICDKSNGQTYIIGVRVENGGTMTNHGTVIVGNGGGGGYLEVENGGVWTALGTFYLAHSSLTSTLLVKSGGFFSCGGEFLTGNANGGLGVVTNAGTMVFNDLFVGVDTRGVFVNEGSLIVSNKFTLGRNKDGRCELMKLCKGSSFVKTSKSQPIHIGNKCPSKMVVEESFSMTSGTGGQIYLGGAAATGRGELVLNDASISNLTEVSFASAECQGGGGTITLNGASELQGTDVALLFRSLQDSSLTLNDGARLRAKSLRLNAANPKDGSPLAGLEGLTAQMTLNAGSKIDSITNLQLTAANPKATTRLAMRGGEVELTSRNQPSEYNLFLGTRTAAGAVEVVGWGAIRQSPGSPQDWLRMKPYGQIIADGEGEMRDLDFGVIRTVGVNFEATNQSRETDGWYARNGGRLLYPHVQPFDHDEHTEICVGEHPWVEPSLINAFKVSLTHSGKAEMFGELYAPDRTDIPAGLAACVPKDGRIQGVWRAGLMRTSSSGGGPKTFSDATLKFRYDPTGLQPGWRLRLLHHDGTPRGRWTVVGRGPYDPDVKTISTTRPLQAVSNVDYNLGWFAVVGGERQGSVLIFR